MTLRSNNQQKYIYPVVPLHIRKTSLITRFIRYWSLGDSNNPTLLRCIVHEYYVTSLFIEKSEKMRDDEKNREEENVGKEDGKGLSILWYAFNLRKKRKKFIVNLLLEEHAALRSAKKGGKGRTKGSSIVYSDVGWCRREEQRRRVAENSTVR